MTDSTKVIAVLDSKIQSEVSTNVTRGLYSNTESLYPLINQQTVNL